MKRISVFLIGAALSLICLEAGLRGLGIVHRMQMRSSRPDVPNTRQRTHLLFCASETRIPRALVQRLA
jgi:hypothetical protein